MSGAFAQEATDANTSVISVPEVTPKETKKDIDEEITNARLRATTGAKSNFSFQSDLTYSGGSIEKPVDKLRPSLSPGSTAEEISKLSGSISMKWRATDRDNLNFGVGVGLTTPGYDGQQGQIESPYLSYGRLFKAAGLQNVFSVTVTKYTSRQLVDIAKRDYNFDIAHTILGSIGNSGWEAGLVFNIGRETYFEGVNGVEDYAAIFPFAEYAFNDRYSFRTVYRGMTYYTVRSNPWTFEHDDATQSAGIGIAVARDFYLYPNVQWVWEDVRSDKTNIAISANFNL